MITLLVATQLREEAQVTTEMISTAAISDACIRLGVQLRLAPPGLRPLGPGLHLSGPVRPARHSGSVDTLLEAIASAYPGDVLVVDDSGRLERACVGDLVVAELQHSGLAGAVIWGAHRDSRGLRDLQVPIFSYGSCPAGPAAVEERPERALEAAEIGSACWVELGDYVFADDDGATFVPGDSLDEVTALAKDIQGIEGKQLDLIVRGGASLSEQVRFEAFLEKRALHPDWTFRDHLKEVGRAVEV